MRPALAVSAAALLSLGLAAATAAPAHADDAEGYRPIMIGVDVTADAIIVASVVGGSSGPALVGLAGYLLGGPVVHASHGQWTRAGASVGIRIGAPLVLGFAGCALADGDSSDDGPLSGLACAFGFFGGAAVGIVGAQIIDIAAMGGSYDDGTTSAPRIFSIGGSF